MNEEQNKKKCKHCGHEAKSRDKSIEELTELSHDLKDLD